VGGLEFNKYLDKIAKNLKEIYDFHRRLFKKTYALYARLDDAAGGSVSA